MYVQTRRDVCACACMFMFVVMVVLLMTETLKTSNDVTGIIAIISVFSLD